jgi:hypothetical protein
MAAEARMNLSWEIELPCAAELFVETTASPSRCVVRCKWGERVVEKAVKVNTQEVDKTII